MRGNRDRRPAQLLWTVVVVLGSACVALLGFGGLIFAQGEEGTGEARNVILMIGDGMGPAQRDAGQLATVGPYDRLVMDSLPYAGLVGTNSVDPEEFVADSAASATSMASGVKTVNGAIGVDPDGEEVETILEQAKAAGKATGLVTTSRVTSATPAAFAAHVEERDRDEEREVGRQLIEETGVDVILGGGEESFLPEGEEGAYPDEEDDDEEDDPEVSQTDLVERAEELGYEYVTDAEELRAARGPKLLGIFANEGMFQSEPEGEGDSYDPAVPLPEMTQKAIDTLSEDPEGFFLMVEEEAIDAMGHDNNSPLMIKGVQELDRSVEIARDFTETSGDTLLIVTADHECCGLTVEEPDDPDEDSEDLDESGEPNAGEEQAVSVEDGPIPVANSDYEFVLDYTTTDHTGVDVPLTAMGPGAERLTGNYENTRIYEVMAKGMGLTSTGSSNSSSSDTASSGTAPDTGVAVMLLAGLLGGAGLLVAGSRLRRS